MTTNHSSNTMNRSPTSKFSISFKENVFEEHLSFEIYISSLSDKEIEVFAWIRNSYVTHVILPMGRIKEEHFHMNSLCIGCIGHHITLSSTSLCTIMKGTFKKNFGNWKVCKKKNQTWVFGADRKFHPSGSLFGITQQSLVMPNSDPGSRSG